METRKSKILIVEDESIVAEDLSSLLRSMDYEVTGICASGEEIFDAVQRNMPDLILMDIKLQGEQDGIQTATQLRSVIDIPVIFVTALTDDETLERAKLTQPFGYIVKPFEDREIHSSIEITLYKHAMDMTSREREAWYRTTLNSLHEAVVTCDASGRVTFLNPKAELLTGWPGADAIGRTLAEIITIVDAATRERLRSPIDRVIQDNVLFDASNHRVLITRDGYDIHIEESTAPIINDRGEIIGALLLFLDVEEQRGKEREYLQHLRLYRLLAEASPDSICVINLDGTIEYVNPAAAALSRSSPEALIGQAREKLHSADQNSMQSACFKEILESKTAARLDMRLREDERELWQDVWMIPLLDQQGDVQAVMEIARDITARKRSDQEIVRYALELKNIVQRKDVLFDVLSRDLSSPSNTLLNYCELLLARAGSMASAAQNGAPVETHHPDSRPDVQAPDSQSATRLPSRYISLQTALLNLREAVDDALWFCDTRLREKTIHCENFIDRDLSARSNPKMMRAIMRGLLSETVESTRPGGDIKVYCRQDESGTELSVHFTLKDVAPCIPEWSSAAERRDADAEMQSAGNYGLITCRELVELQGGTLAITSVSADDRCISITIPEDPAAAGRNRG